MRGRILDVVMIELMDGFAVSEVRKSTIIKSRKKRRSRLWHISQSRNEG